MLLLFVGSDSVFSHSGALNMLPTVLFPAVERSGALTPSPLLPEAGQVPCSSFDTAYEDH